MSMAPVMLLPNMEPGRMDAMAMDALGDMTGCSEDQLNDADTACFEISNPQGRFKVGKLTLLTHPVDIIRPRMSSS